MNKYIRKIKTSIKIFSALIYYPFFKLNIQPLTILSRKETIERIVNEHLSVARFGDSEYLYVTGSSDNLQTTNKVLQDKLVNVLVNPCSKLMVCHVDYLNLKESSLNAKLSAIYFYTKTFKKVIKIIDVKTIFGNSNMTRFYLGLKDRTQAPELFTLIMKIWESREIIIIEGENTFFGLDTDLIMKSKKVERIICPSKQAFNFYDEIIKTVSTYSNNKLIICSLGVTATILANELTKLNYQVIDIGNISKEYYAYVFDNSLKMQDVTSKDQYLAQIISKIN